MKIAFFDRDGTIVADYPDSQWKNVNSLEFLPGSIELLQKIKYAGYEIIIITNQYLIDENFISYSHYVNLTNQFIKTLELHQITVKDIFFCPHKRNIGCGCSKPSIGMITKAIHKYTEIQLQQSFIVGNSKADMLMAKQLNIPGIAVAKKAYNISSHLNYPSTLHFLNDWDHVHRYLQIRERCVTSRQHFKNTVNGYENES